MNSGFVDLAEARRRIEAWRLHYNTVRPHSSLGFLSPEQFRRANERGTGQARSLGERGTNREIDPLSSSQHGGYNSSHFLTFKVDLNWGKVKVCIIGEGIGGGGRPKPGTSDR